MTRSALLVLFGLLTASTVTAASISGTVTAADTGRALSGIVVAAYSSTGTLQATATTDSFGHYTLTVGAGQMGIVAYDLAAEYATSYYSNAHSFETSQRFAFTSSETVTGINFSLVRGGRIAGKVVDEATGVSLPGMTVAAYTTGGIRREQVQTDSSGNFSILLPPGEYIVVAWDQQFRYVSEFYSNVPKASLASRVSVASGVTRSGVQFTLAIGGQLYGSVVDQATGAPLPGMTVSAYSPTGELLVQSRTDSTGTFLMAVSPGTVRLVAHDDAGIYAGSFYDNAEAFTLAREIQLTAGQTVSGIEFRVSKAGRVAGRVTDATTGAGLPGQAVLVYNLSGTLRQLVYTDASGSFSAVVPPGYYKVAASDPQGVYAWQYWAGRPTFQQSDSVLVVSQQTSPVSFSVSLAARVSGTVIDRTLASIISGVIVSARDASGATIATAVTANDGTYTLALPPGTYKLVATDPSGRFPPAYEGNATSWETAPARTLSSGQAVNVGFEFGARSVARRRAAGRG